VDDVADLQELNALLGSRVPIILVETHEEPRVLSMLSRLAQRTSTPMFHWSIADGIVRNGMDLAIYNTNELLDALKHVDKTPQAGIYVFCDAHPGLSNPVNVRLIREIALEHHETGRTLVFVSPKLEGLPSELLRLAAHFRPRLPSREDIRAIVDQEAQLYHSQSGEKARAERSHLDQLVMHLMGLETEDVRRMVRQALRPDGRIDGDDVRRVLASKLSMLGGAEALGFETGSVRFGDVGGLEQLKRWVTLRRAPFLDASTGTATDCPRGVVLLGVQGGGKSLAARAIAGEWGLPLMRLDFGALHNKYHGETERSLRQAIAVAEGMAPCVLWMDEIEKGLASSGGGESDGGVGRRVLGSLLTWMSERTRPVFVVATANDISQLPPELVRKGRFDEIFFVDFPGEAARRRIFEIHLRKRRLDPAAFDLAALAAHSEQFSGAEIEQAIVAASFETRARKAVLDTAAVTAELVRTRPLSTVMAERIDALRDWASTRSVMADAPETAVGVGSAETATAG
jgi:SpoVK/Ycf46/Vps4 family AAA+-type ATPase